MLGNKEQFIRGRLESLSNAFREVYWPGGNGAILVKDVTFSGPSAKLTISGFQDPLGGGGLFELIPGVPDISADGVYRFSAPEGSVLMFQVALSSGDYVEVNTGIWIARI